MAASTTTFQEQIILAPLRMEERNPFDVVWTTVLNRWAFLGSGEVMKTAAPAATGRLLEMLPEDRRATPPLPISMPTPAAKYCATRDSPQPRVFLWRLGDGMEPQRQES